MTRKENINTFDKEHFIKLLQETESEDERQELMNRLVEQYPDITMKEAMEMGFTYGEIIF